VLLTADETGLEVVTAPVTRQEQAADILEGESLHWETYCGKSYVFVLIVAVYVAQNPAARVDERTIWRRQLFRWHEAVELDECTPENDDGYPGLSVMSEDGCDVEDPEIFKADEVVSSPGADELAPEKLEEVDALPLA
jgi:hypothetical protein